MLRRGVDNLHIVILDILALALGAALIMPLERLHGGGVAGVDVEHRASVGNALGVRAGGEIADYPVALDDGVNDLQRIQT